MTLILSLLLADEFTDLVSKLRSAPDAVQRYQHENQLSRLAKPGHVPILLKEIDTGPEEFRPHFVRVLRAIGGRDAQQALKAILTRYDWGCRGETAVALKFLGDESGLKYLVGEFPKPTMKRDDRMKVVPYLFAYYADSKEAAAALRKVLEAEKDDPLRTRIIDALVSHRDFEALPLLRKIAANLTDPVRYDALAAMIRLTDTVALDTVLDELEEGKVPLSGLYKVLDALRLVASGAVADRLRAILEKTSDVNTRVQIIRTLAALRDGKSLPIFRRLAEDSDPSVSAAAMDAILDMAGRGEIDNVRKLLNHDRIEVRLRAAEVLLALDDVSGLEVVKAELSHRDATRRRRAASVLLASRRKEIVEPCIAAMEDSDLQVRTTASTALVAALSSLFPYVKFDLKKVGYDPTSEDTALRSHALEKIREWWGKNGPK